MTPAQAYGHPNFVTDVPVQGPTDEGLRSADCWQDKNRIPAPADTACVDCKGPIPMWAQQALSNVRGRSAGIGEALSLGGRPVRGFGIAGAGDPDVWTGLSAAQQKWVTDTLVKLNDIIVQTTGTTCPTWGPSITAAGGCFQQWFNKNLGGKLTSAAGKPVMLRTDGVFDQETLDALITTAGIHGQQFPTPYPSGAVTTTEEKKGLSKGAMIAGGAAALALVGGGIYAVTSGKKRHRKR